MIVPWANAAVIAWSRTGGVLGVDVGGGVAAREVDDAGAARRRPPGCPERPRPRSSRTSGCRSSIGRIGLVGEMPWKRPGARGGDRGDLGAVGVDVRRVARAGRGVEAGKHPPAQLAVFGSTPVSRIATGFVVLGRDDRGGGDRVRRAPATGWHPARRRRPARARCAFIRRSTCVANTPGRARELVGVRRRARARRASAARRRADRGRAARRTHGSARERGAARRRREHAASGAAEAAAGAASAALTVSAEMMQACAAHQPLPERSTFTIVLTLTMIGIGTWKPLHGCVGMPGARQATTLEDVRRRADLQRAAGPSGRPCRGRRTSGVNSP